jgi:hypothetical protein
MARFVSISFLLAVVTAMAATTFLPARAAELTIDILPHAALDTVEDVVVVIRGGAPGEEVTLETKAVDRLGDTWTARNTYVFDPNGTVDIARQIPFEGTYDAVDPRGPFWSMARDRERLAPWGFGRHAKQLPQFFIPTRGAHRVSLTAKSGRNEADAVVAFSTWNSDVVRRTVSDPLIIGTFYEPDTPSPWPVVIVLGGQSFGYRSAQFNAARLASAGYGALALAYAGVDGTPRHLTGIPLEYFDDALSWVRAQINVDARHIAIMGVGFDSGLALLLAAQNPNTYRAVIAGNPHAVTFPALGQRGSPLTRNRALIAHAPLAHWDDDYAKTGHPLYIYEKSLILFEDAVTAARIPVEQTKSAILLVSGSSDLIQPSERMGRMIVESMVDAGLGDQVRHVVFPDAGAMLSGDGVLPTGPGVPRFGGSAQGIATAQFYGWREVLSFLEVHLR